MIKKINKNKVKVQYLKDSDEVKKETLKYLDIQLANELKKKGLIKIVEVWDSARDLEQEEKINLLIERVNVLEEKVVLLKKATKLNKEEPKKKEPKNE